MLLEPQHQIDVLDATAPNSSSSGTDASICWTSASISPSASKPDSWSPSWPQSGCKALAGCKALGSRRTKLTEERLDRAPLVGLE
ncbi:hypothetical protein ABZ747_26420 [Kitasatospora cineracea]|uniref:hypothetical protein n=1 Tax=Kitasatospora cineracea TaxID=88074 RepID=UPI0033F7432C